MQSRLWAKITAAALCRSAHLTTSRGKTLVCVMNGGSGKLDLRLLLPTEAGGGREFYSGRSVAAGETVPCTLPPGEVAVFVLVE